MSEALSKIVFPKDKPCTPALSIFANSDSEKPPSGPISILLPENFEAEIIESEISEENPEEEILSKENSEEENSTEIQESEGEE